MIVERVGIFLIFMEILILCSGSNESCPTWLYQSEETEQCTCGTSLTNNIICNNETQDVYIFPPYCLTSLSPDSDEAVVGSCIYGQRQGHTNFGKYQKVYKNISEQNRMFCGYVNREGRLCGDCKKDYFVSPYSYDLKCYKCKRGFFINVILYLTVAYVPLTLFLIAVYVFSISVASPQLHIAVLLFQVYSQPESVRVLVQNTRDTKWHVIVQVVSTLYGVWNLDFFRTVIPPICLPLTMPQVIALDYLVAIYPLLLLICFYLLVTAHDRGCKLLQKLFRPFVLCAQIMRKQWNVKKSIIDAFATFILLSYLKFLTTSFDLLITTSIRDVHGSNIGYSLYYDGTVEFMGREHLPFFILAAIVLFLALLFPLLLLLYPMKHFQMFLNKYCMNSPGLRTFMDCFQGYYRDRTEGGRECRYFAALYPLLRIGGTMAYAIQHNNAFLNSLTIMILIILVIAVIFSPYKEMYKWYNKLDVLMFLSLVGFGATATIHTYSYDITTTLILSLLIAGLFGSVPLVYMVFVLCSTIKQWMGTIKDSFARKDYQRISGEQEEPEYTAIQTI